MKIDLTCPVELWRYDLPTQDYPVCTLSLLNLTEKPVASILASFVCYDREGDEIARHVERVRELQGSPRQLFDLSVAVEEGVFAADMEFLIDKVWFEDGTVWRRGANSFVDYQPNNMPNNRKLEMLRYLAGDDAVGYPSDQGPLWLCVCGRANAASDDVCCRCGRDKTAQFEHLTQAAVEKVLHAREMELEHRAVEARETASRMEQTREQKRLRRRRIRKRLLITASLLVLLTGATYGVYHHGLPYYRYWLAGRALESGELTDARARFDTMPDYRDSASLALECEYREASSLLFSTSEDTLMAARDAFDALALQTLPLPLKDDPAASPQPGGYRDSARLAMQARYQLAELCLRADDYEGAIGYFEQIPSYNDARARVTQTHYLWARAAEDGGDLSLAREKYLALGGYEDSAQRATECLYALAGQALADQEFELAASRYVLLSDYKDSQTRIKETHYLWGAQLFEQKAFDQAAEHYLLAGTYKDAALMAAACLYEPAVAAMEEERYAEAAAMFEKISTHKDSAARAKECYYILGTRALNAGAYDQALTLLSAAGDHQDAAALCLECHYRAAQDALEAADYAGALERLAIVPKYRDAAALMARAQYGAGVKLMEEKDYAAAAAIFSSLAEAGDTPSAQRLTEALYAQGAAELEAGRYEAALEFFARTPGYQSTAAYILRAHYSLGKARMDEKLYEQAEAHFAQAAGYEDADTLLNECRYIRVKAALESNDTDTAVTLLAVLGTYKDSQTLYQDIAYARAEALFARGEYVKAGDAFAAMGGYGDAAQRAAACYEALFGSAAETARNAQAAGRYADAVATLEAIDLNALPAAYADLKPLFQEACYKEANRLYNAGEVYEALPYYERIPTYKDVADRLTRHAYIILGDWVGASSKSQTAQFRLDGTCTINGKTVYFAVDGLYALKTGETPEKLTRTHSIVTLNENALTLIDTAADRTLRFTRVR